MTAQARVHRDIDDLLNRYNPEHDIGVDFNYIDRRLLDMIEDLQTQVEELAARIWVLEKGNENGQPKTS